MNQDFNDIQILANRIKGLSNASAMLTGDYTLSNEREAKEIAMNLSESAAFFADLLSDKLHELELKTSAKGGHS